MDNFSHFTTKISVLQITQITIKRKKNYYIRGIPSLGDTPLGDTPKTPLGGYPLKPPMWGKPPHPQS